MKISAVNRFQSSSSATPSQLNWKWEEQIAHDFVIETALLDTMIERRAARKSKERKKIVTLLEKDIKEERKERKRMQRQLKEMKARIQESGVEIHCNS